MSQMPQNEAAILSWENLDSKQRRILLHQLLVAIAEWQPLRPELLKPLPTPVLRSLLEIINQLKAEGLAGSGRQTPQRVQRLRELIAQRGLGPSQTPTEDQVLRQQPAEMQRQVYAQEAVGMRRAHALEAQSLTQQLARANNPLTGL